MQEAYQQAPVFALDAGVPERERRPSGANRLNIFSTFGGDT